MSEVEDTSLEGAGGGGSGGSNLTAVQSISAKLLEVTRLAEKLDARLCEAGARSQGLNPAVEEEGEDVGDAASAIRTSPVVKDTQEAAGGAIEGRSSKLEVVWYFL